MIDADALTLLLPDFLPRQRWFAGDDATVDVHIAEFEVLRGGDYPWLAWCLVRTADGGSYQLFVGFRPIATPERFLEGKGRYLLGDVDVDGEVLLAYDALIDPDLAGEVLRLVAPGEDFDVVRPLTVEQSNTSIVFDDRLILKVFRRIHPGANPDIEVGEALDRLGYTGVAATHAVWRRGGNDLAVVRTFLAGGADGWHLALTSLRDLYDRRLPPPECGGDFAPESERLGAVTAELHVALAEAFGSTAGDAAAWAEVANAGLVDIEGVEGLDPAAVAAVYGAMAGERDAGRAIRIHGDLHLGQVVRADTGWYVLDFEGEPRVPVAERTRPSSPLRDVAGMLRSFHYAAGVALHERREAADDELSALARAWEQRNVAAYLHGYLSTPGIAELLPGTEVAQRRLLDAFVLAKAVYEVGYEHDHRPELAGIPIEAVARLAGMPPAKERPHA